MCVYVYILYIFTPFCFFFLRCETSEFKQLSFNNAMFKQNPSSVNILDKIKSHISCICAYKCTLSQIKL